MTNRSKADDTVTASTGNALGDLGLISSDEDILKVEIARAISNILTRYELSQVEAAQLMLIDQPKVSKIIRGRLKEFSSERLMDYLMLLGCDIDIRITRRKKSKRGRLTVAAAA